MEMSQTNTHNEVCVHVRYITPFKLPQLIWKLFYLICPQLVGHLDYFLNCSLNQQATDILDILPYFYISE